MTGIVTGGEAESGEIIVSGILAGLRVWGWHALRGTDVTCPVGLC